MSIRVAVSIKSLDGLDSVVDPRFGRANAFVIVELETKQVVAGFLNDAAAAVEGAGTAAAVEMKSNNVAAVITGRLGPRAIQSLQVLGIEMWTAPEGITAREALDRFSAGALSRLQVKVY